MRLKQIAMAIMATLGGAFGSRATEYHPPQLPGGFRVTKLEAQSKPQPRRVHSWRKARQNLRRQRIHYPLPIVRAGRRNAKGKLVLGYVEPRRVA